MKYIKNKKEFKQVILKNVHYEIFFTQAFEVKFALKITDCWIRNTISKLTTAE